MDKNKKVSIRSIFDRLKSVGIELFSPPPKPQSVSEITFKNNYEAIFKEEYNKCTIELRNIIDKKIECRQFNDFIKKVIELNELSSE